MAPPATHPAVLDARELLALEDEFWTHWRRKHDAAWDSILYRAFNLSGGDLSVCEALLRGEDVPASRLDPYWVQRLGVRRAA